MDRICETCGKNLGPMLGDTTYPMHAILVVGGLPQKQLIFCDWPCISKYGVRVHLKKLQEEEWLS